jgi:hypothetical protein
MPSTKLRRCGNGRRRTRLSLPGSKRDFVRPKLRRCICFALTKDLVNDARDGRGGVDYNAVLRDVFFRLMPSRNEFPVRRLSAAPLIVRSLVKPPIQCGKVDLKDKNACRKGLQSDSF